MKTAASAEAKMIIFLLLILPRVLNQDLVSFTPVLNYRRKGAVCMDGSPAGYFFQAGFGDGANNWHISIEGARWCYSNTTCAAAGYQGSSRHMSPKKFSGMLSSSQSVNPDFYNWNQVLLHNCDGGFFYADAKHITATYNLQLQRLYSFESIMIDLQMRGLRTADNAILSGGLAALVNCDRFRGYILDVPTVKCLSDGGYYIYADNPAYNDTTVQSLAEAVQYQGLDDKYPPTCGEFSNSSCLFPQYFIDKIETPLFIINSVFDRYQI